MGILDLSTKQQQKQPFQSKLSQQVHFFLGKSIFQEFKVMGNHPHDRPELRILPNSQAPARKGCVSHKTESPYFAQIPKPRDHEPWSLTSKPMSPSSSARWPFRQAVWLHRRPCWSATNVRARRGKAWHDSNVHTTPLYKRKGHQKPLVLRGKWKNLMSETTGSPSILPTARTPFFRGSRWETHPQVAATHTGLLKNTLGSLFSEPTSFLRTGRWKIQPIFYK